MNNSKRDIRKLEKCLILVSQNCDCFHRVSVNQLLEVVQGLLEIRERYTSFQHEKRVILAHFGVHADDEKGSDILTAFQKFVVTNDETMQELKKQIKELEDIVLEKSSTSEHTTSLQGFHFCFYS